MSGSPRVSILWNFIPPYHLSLLERLQARLGNLEVCISTCMEPNRRWEPKWDGLSVTVQKCWTQPTRWRHPQGFSDPVWRHFPYDTLWLLMKNRPRVVISAQLGFRTAQAALYRRMFPRTRLIISAGLSEHTEEGLPAWRTLQRRALLMQADAVLVNGASGRKYLVGLGVPHERIFLTPYCPEIARHLELPLQRPAELNRRLISIGQLIVRKGLLPFLDALSGWLQRYTETSAEFWIAGDGTLRSELEGLSIPSRLRLRFLGDIPYEKLPGLYAQGGIFAFPTLADEWGVVVNEALAAGLPVLGSRYSQAVHELINDDVNGWTFRPDHPDEVYAALDRAMSSPDDQLGAMRSAARERVRSLTPQFGAECYAAAIDFALSSNNGHN